MTVFEFLRFCPPDHKIIIHFAKARKQIVFKYKREVFNNPKIDYKDLYEEMGFVHADEHKSLFITTKV